MLLDEQLSCDIAEELRRRALDVHAINVERPDLEGTSDEGIMEAAHAEQRAVVTNNIKDHRPIAASRHAADKGHSGLILLPASRSRTKAATQQIADGVEQIMRANPSGLSGTERWVVPFR